MPALFPRVSVRCRGRFLVFLTAAWLARSKILSRRQALPHQLLALEWRLQPNLSWRNPDEFGGAWVFRVKI